MTQPPVVHVEGLSKVFPGPPSVEALHPCSVEVQPGEFVAITGPSGSGKTTLLSLLGLLDTPTTGRYVLAGRDVAKLNDNERAAARAHLIGFVFQAFHLVAYRTVLENVELGLVYQGIPRRERRDRAREVIEGIGLQHRERALCATLSGGEKQRVAIARTLVRNPVIVLCDEPTGNLDTANSSTVLDTLSALRDNGLTVLVITHDPIVAARAERRLGIRDGYLNNETHTEEPASADGGLASVNDWQNARRE